ncbi:hypothetical protein COOONC_08593 [Cooperia oncophora]
MTASTGFKCTPNPILMVMLHTQPLNTTKYRIVSTVSALVVGAVELPSSLMATEVLGGVEITWKHNPKPERVYTFYITLHERFRPPIEFKDPNAFRYRIADDGERELSGTKGQVNYTYTFDYDLQRLEEYKVTLFAEDDHYCHTDDATTYFNTSAIETMLPPRAIPKTSFSSLERFMEGQYTPHKFNSTADIHSRPD